MRKLLIALSLITAAAVGVSVGTVVAQPMDQHQLARLSPDLVAQSGRPCVHTTGGWTEIDCSAAAAYSAQLSSWSRIIVQAIGGSPYIAWHSAGSGGDADSSDGTLPENSWYEFVVGPGARYLTCDGSADTSKLRYIECK